MKPASRLQSLLPITRDELDSIPGWFGDTDPYVLSVCAAIQNRFAIDGDILEIGSYMGQSAVLLGRLTTAGQRLVVCDLFESTPADARNAAEAHAYYTSLTRQAFEDNYRRVNGELPEILQMHSTEAGEVLRGRKFRLIHVDGSHEWQAVTKDLAMANELLLRDGLVVLDDFRSTHAMGVAAAAWAAILSGTLTPLVVTHAKLYAAFGRPTYTQDLFAELSAIPELRAERFAPLGDDVLCLPQMAPSFRHPLLRELLPPFLRSALIELRDRTRRIEARA